VSVFICLAQDAGAKVQTEIPAWYRFYSAPRETLRFQVEHASQIELPDEFDSR
jgi:hypothetical protein